MKVQKLHYSPSQPETEKNDTEQEDSSSRSPTAVVGGGWRAPVDCPYAHSA